jgi:hypothetical protein
MMSRTLFVSEVSALVLALSYTKVESTIDSFLLIDIWFSPWYTVANLMLAITGPEN